MIAKPSAKQIRFIANPTQKAFLENRPFEGFVRPADWPEDVKPQVVDLFSCRMGEGKSAALCWAVWFYTKYNPGAECGLVRDTWENMRETTMQEFLKWFPHGLVGTYEATRKRFTWTAEGMHGGVSFMGMDDEKDASRFQSREFGFLGFDEPSPAAGTGGMSAMILETGLTRLRQPNMQWYAAKLAQNNPDEGHWTYKKFIDPGTPGYTHFQTRTPENEKNLPPGYYNEMAKDLSGRPDLQRRFVEGQFGYQQLGHPVVPRWNDKVHLASGLEPIPNCELVLSWDGGLTPVCTINQIAPSGIWYVLDCLIETDGGIYQLIEEQVYTLLETRYSRFKGQWCHIGDPSLENREQSDSRQSAVRVMKEKLGGSWRKGPIDIFSGTDPLNKRIGLLGPGGQGMVQVDRNRAKAVWHALRGGWHYPRHSGGVVGTSPIKNHPDSDVGDTMRYFAGIFYPRGEQKKTKSRYGKGKFANYGHSSSTGSPSLKAPKLHLPDGFREIQ